MPIFKVRFERDYTIVEGFDRYVEAEDEDAAAEKTEAMAREFDDDCPDDCSEIGSREISEFCVLTDREPVDAAPAGEEVL